MVFVHANQGDSRGCPAMMQEPLEAIEAGLINGGRGSSELGVNLLNDRMRGYNTCASRPRGRRRRYLFLATAAAMVAAAAVLLVVHAFSPDRNRGETTVLEVAARKYGIGSNNMPNTKNLKRKGIRTQAASKTLVRNSPTEPAETQKRTPKNMHLAEVGELTLRVKEMNRLRRIRRDLVSSYIGNDETDMSSAPIGRISDEWVEASGLEDVQQLQTHIALGVSAMELLVNQHMWLVKSYVHSLGLKGEVAQDAIQEGTLGLMAAVERFDPTMGAQLPTYAQYWVRNKVAKFLQSNSNIRVPQGMMEDINKLNKARTRWIIEHDGDEPEASDLVDVLHKPEKDVENLLLFDRTRKSASLDDVRVDLGRIRSEPMDVEQQKELSFLEQRDVYRSVMEYVLDGQRSPLTMSQRQLFLNRLAPRHPSWEVIARRMNMPKSTATQQFRSGVEKLRKTPSFMQLISLDE